VNGVALFLHITLPVKDVMCVLTNIARYSTNHDGVGCVYALQKGWSKQQEAWGTLGDGREILGV